MLTVSGCYEEETKMREVRIERNFRGKYNRIEGKRENFCYRQIKLRFQNYVHIYDEMLTEKCAAVMEHWESLQI